MLKLCSGLSFSFILFLFCFECHFFSALTEAVVHASRNLKEKEDDDEKKEDDDDEEDDDEEGYLVKKIHIEQAIKTLETSPAVLMIQVLSYFFSAFTNFNLFHFG